MASYSNYRSNNTNYYINYLKKMGELILNTKFKSTKGMFYYCKKNEEGYLDVYEAKPCREGRHKSKKKLIEIAEKLRIKQEKEQLKIQNENKSRETSTQGLD